TVLQFHVLELLVLLVRPAHRPDELVPVLLDRQLGRPLLAADLVLALPRPDRVCLVLRPDEAAQPEHQHRENDLHAYPREVAGADATLPAAMVRGSRLPVKLGSAGGSCQ